MCVFCVRQCVNGSSCVLLIFWEFAFCSCLEDLGIFFSELISSEIIVMNYSNNYVGVYVFGGFFFRSSFFSFSFLFIFCFWK